MMMIFYYYYYFVLNFEKGEFVGSKCMYLLSKGRLKNRQNLKRIFEDDDDDDYDGDNSFSVTRCSEQKSRPILAKVAQEGCMIC